MFLHRFHFLTENAINRAFVAILAIGLFGSATKTHAESYLLSTGDRLEVEILENQQIGGDYTVAADGAVSVPGIGVVAAEGLTLREFEDNLRQAAARKIADPSISVQIAQYRPFYVLGDVGDAGAYAYAPDLTVMRAVALAGGFGRNVSGNALSRAVAVSQARKSLFEGQVDLASSKVNLARLKAEKAMADSFDFTPGSDDAGLGDDLAVLVADAQTLFDTRQNAFKTRLAKLENTLTRRSEETQSFESQIALQRERLETSQQELREIQDAHQQGIVSSDRLNSVVRFEQNVRAQTLQIETLKRQSEVSAAEVESQIADLVVSREQELDRDIQALSETIERLETRAREDRALLAATGASAGLAASGERDFRFEIHRDGAQVQGSVDLHTRVRPGDTLLVIMELSD